MEEKNALLPFETFFLCHTGTGRQFACFILLFSKQLSDLLWPVSRPMVDLSIFDPVSKATKAMKIGPRLPKLMKNRPCNHNKIQFLRNLFFAIPSTPNACFSDPRHPNLDPKIIRKSNLEIDMKKNGFLIQMYFKSSQNGSPKSKKNR